MNVWHDINYVMDDATDARAVKVIGKKEAEQFQKAADAGRAKVGRVAYQPQHFHNLGALPKVGQGGPHRGGRGPASTSTTPSPRPMR
jgi:hypothetical protein